MEDIAKHIVGAWRLVHSVIVSSDGSREYPFGEDAIGYICYSDSGVMAVQISRKSRGAVEDLKGLNHDYLAYFGRYEIDLDRQVVRHFLEGQLFPDSHADLLERTYCFDGDLMSLRPVDRPNYEILWQRVRSSSSS